ncbi:Fc.00g055030.m01.CDS01 [Cosmosporella sp. VM-42]
MLRNALTIASLIGLSVETVTSRTVNNDNLAPLTFSEDGKFQIAIFSDMHFGGDESGTGPQQDRGTVRVIGEVLDYDPPDLVVLNGDLINGDSTYAENSTHYIDQIVAPMVERNLTWASTYGNHDHNYNITGDGILEREQMWSGARTQKMVNTSKSGVTNYYLLVYPANCTDTSTCNPELLLWFFDSRGGFYYQGEDQEDWVDSSVVTWFNDTNTELVDTYGKVIPSLAFVHIPINATEALQTELGIHEHYQPGINDDPPVPQQGEGWCSDGTRDEDNCPYGGQDEPFMEALVTIPGIMGLFYGHDHGNSWCYRWDSQLDGMNIKGNGIHLCYGQHSGYGGYGDWIRGGRQIVVTEEKLKGFVVDTHIRLETGDVVGSVALNSTFNHDYYPATPNTKTYFSESSDNGDDGIGNVYVITKLPARQVQGAAETAEDIVVENLSVSYWSCYNITLNVADGDVDTVLNIVVTLLSEVLAHVKVVV